MARSASARCGRIARAKNIGGGLAVASDADAGRGRRRNRALGTGQGVVAGRIRRKDRNACALTCESRVKQLCKVPLPHERRGHGNTGVGEGKGDAICLRIRKVEYLVPPDRQTKGGSELVLVVGGNSTPRVPVLAIKPSIADIFPQISVDLVGARLDAGVEHGSSRVPELGTVVGSVDLEFSQRIRWRLDIVAGAVHEVVGIHIVVDTIEDEVVLGGALAIGREVARAGAPAKAIDGRIDAGRQLRNIDPVAPVECRFVDGVSVHYLTHGSVLTLEQRRRSGYRHGLPYTTGLQGDIDAQPVLDIDAHIFLGRSLKPGSRRAHRVIADLDRRKVVLSSSVRRALQYEIRVGISECNHGVRDDCTCDILHNTGDGSLVNLG